MESKYHDQSLAENLIMTEVAEPVKPTALFGSYRLLIAILLAYAFFSATTMRIDLGIAMVCMVNSTAFLDSANENNDSVRAFIKNNGNSACNPKDYAETLLAEGYTGTILWTPKMQSMLFSAIFYGSAVSALPAGVLADQKNPRILLLIAIGDIALITLLTPLLAYISFYALFVARVLMGLAVGFIWPTISTISSHWFPATERSTAAAIFSSGNQIATSTIYWIGAALCSTSFLGGWPSIFYILGVNACIWMILWAIFVTNYPTDNRFISVQEKVYVTQSLKAPARKAGTRNIPWKAIILSLPNIANLFAMFTANFTVFLLQSFLPTFFKDVLLMNLEKNGLFATLPFLSQLIVKNIYGVLSDSLKKHNILRATTACKIFQVLGNSLQCIALVSLGYLVDCTTPKFVMALLILQGIGAASMTPGSLTSLLCIAPAYTGTLISMSMFLGQIGGTLAPNMVALIRKNGTQSEWSLIFLVTGLINIASAIFFGFFASAEKQAWADPPAEHLDGVKSEK